MNNKDITAFILFFMAIGAALGVTIYTWNSEIATSVFFISFGLIIFFGIGRVFHSRSFKRSLISSLILLRIAIVIIIVKYSANLINYVKPFNIIVPKTWVNGIWSTYPYVLTALIIVALYEITVIVKNRKRW